jgi:hypothetical protein
VLDAKSDKLGRYFVGVEEKDAPKAASPGPDAGAGAAPSGERTTVTFISVTGAQKLSDALAPLRAIRALGKIGDDRAAEFGLAEPEGTLGVQIGGTEHKLVIGGQAPGGGDRYVRDPDTGEGYAVKGDVFHDVEAADTRLLERELHAWKDTEVRKVHIAAGNKARDLIRGGTESKRFWSDAATPDQNDETAGNWMSKVDRLRPVEYLANDPAGHELVARIEYTGSQPGYLELHKAPSATGKPDYFIVTEHIRRFAKVAQSAGDQVEQDVGSIVR